MTISWATADLSDDHTVEVLALDLRSYGAHNKFCGQAETVLCPDDNTMVKAKLEKEAGKGRVLVVDAGGLRWKSMLGDNVAKAGVENGWAGLIIHGAIRDSVEVNQLPIGIKALGTTPQKTSKRGLGQVSVELLLGGVHIRPGQWIYADEDGVVVSENPLH